MLMREVIILYSRRLELKLCEELIFHFIGWPEKLWKKSILEQPEMIFSHFSHGNIEMGSNTYVLAQTKHLICLEVKYFIVSLIIHIFFNKLQIGIIKEIFTSSLIVGQFILDLEGWFFFSFFPLQYFPPHSPFSDWCNFSPTASFWLKRAQWIWINCRQNHKHD